MPETPEVQPPDPQEQPQEAPPNGVFVPVVYGEDGSVQVEVQRMGDVRVTEIATILEQALRNVRAQLGLSG